MRARRVWLAAVLGAVISAGAFALAPAGASASTDQLSIIQDSSRVLADPAGTLGTFRALGASMVRVIVVWAQIAPDWESPRRPRALDAADPAAYPAANWAPYDAIVKLAGADGIAVDFTLSGGAPRWAEGPGIPRAAWTTSTGPGGRRRRSSASSRTPWPNATAAPTCRRARPRRCRA